MAERKKRTPTNAGAESGGTRSSKRYVHAPGHHKISPEQSAHVGGATTRTPSGTNQGISNRSIAIEDEGQEKVVRKRPDVQAGLNSNRRKAS